MQRLDRRRFLSLSAAAAASASFPSFAQSPRSSSPATRPGNLRFVFLTDTHLQPELKAAEGTGLAMQKIKSMKPEFCIQGGDHIMDMTEVPRERSLMLLDLYDRTQHALDMPVHHVIGNHDVFGRSIKSGVPTSDPLYGKKAFEQRYDSRTYSSFDHAGYHFILLDSIQITLEREFDAMIDPAQIAWLRQDLAALPAGTPIVVTTHVPIVSAAPQYTPAGDKAAKAVAAEATSHLHGFLLGNAREVTEIFDGHNILAVLQGHTHINEVVYWRDIPYITSGAVSGNWWKGSRWGTPEGFTVVELANGAARWHYETYGWHSPEVEPDPLRPVDHPRSAPLPS